MQKSFFNKKLVFVIVFLFVGINKVAFADIDAYYQINTNFSDYDTDYRWMVSAGDGRINNNNVYNFKTILIDFIPTVVTDESTGVNSTNAILHGTLRSNGSFDTTCYFLWGYVNGSLDNNQSVGIIDNGASFSLNISLPKSGTNLYYNTKANNSYGWDNDGGVKEVFIPSKISNSTKIVLFNNRTFVQTVSYTSTYIPQILDFSNPSLGVPDNAIAVLCLFEQAGSGCADPFTLLDYNLNGENNRTGLWIRSLRNQYVSPHFTIWLNGNGNKTSWIYLASIYKPVNVNVYIYGYIIETNDIRDHGTSLVHKDIETQVLTNGNAVSWTDVNCSASIFGNVSGIWASLNSNFKQTIYFRAKGSSDTGIVYKHDNLASNSYQQLFIPTNDSGVFQYYTSVGGNVNIWLISYLSKVGRYGGDRYLLNNNTGWGSSLFTEDNNWHSFNLTTIPTWGRNITEYLNNCKYVILKTGKSPNKILENALRKNGTTNIHNSQYINGCGGFNFLVGINETYKIDYKFQANNTDLGCYGFIYPAESFTIQSAIDNASDGDTIYIPSGIYYENIIIDKSITLIGEDKDTTIIDGGMKGDVVFVSSCGVNISGFTIRNSGSNWDNAGIKLDYSDDITLMDNIISNNYDGIRLFSSRNNIITNNNINSNNNGIYLYYSNNNHLFHNCQINNTQNAYDNSINTWDNGYPSGGNYWSDYTGVDNNGDGIGDTPYIINGVSNQDRYPYMQPNGWNQPPTIPTIDGPIKGKVGITYNYRLKSIDPDKDDVYYIVNWGYCNETETYGPYASGEEVIVDHTWNEKGLFTIKVKAKDIIGAESDWTTLSVKIPRTRIINYLFLKQVFERFQNVLQILKLLLTR